MRGNGPPRNDKKKRVRTESIPRPTPIEPGLYMLRRYYWEDPVCVTVLRDLGLVECPRRKNRNKKPAKHLLLLLREDGSTYKLTVRPDQYGNDFQRLV